MYNALSVDFANSLLKTQWLCFSLGNYLGSGQFGTVNSGMWRMSQQKIKVAIKTLNSNSHEDDKVRFLQEAAIMGQFNHINVIKMHGLVIEKEPVKMLKFFRFTVATYIILCTYKSYLPCVSMRRRKRTACGQLVMQLN